MNSVLPKSGQQAATARVIGNSLSLTRARARHARFNRRGRTVTFRKLGFAAALAATVAAPIAGQAIAAERSVQPVSGQSEMGGGPFGILIVLALVGLAVGIASGDDEPVSA